VESVYPKKRDIPKNFLDGVVGDTKRQVENERAEEVVSSGSIDHDLRVALEVRLSWHFKDFPISLPVISESMGPSTRLLRFLFMIAPLT
jgi:transcription initiation factor TFIID subunit 1, fungi type